QRSLLVRPAPPVTGDRDDRAMRVVLLVRDPTALLVEILPEGRRERHRVLVMHDDLAADGEHARPVVLAVLGPVVVESDVGGPRQTMGATEGRERRSG